VRLRGIAALALWAGCGAAPLDNPSGSCGSRADGGRAGYHAPGDSQWLPDCEPPLAREYWRVFSSDGKTGYIIPRPDGAAELQEACAAIAHQLGRLLDKYPLCRPAQTDAEVKAVNSMDTADALQLTHFLHTQLRFTKIETGPGIAPFPIPGDIIDGCALRGGPSSSPELQAICERERERLRTGHAIGFRYTGPGAVELVARLNELYGIP
jgi:hypothetical protein